MTDFLYWIFIYKKTCVCESLFLCDITNIFIQVAFPHDIPYLNKNFKEEQNDTNFK